MKQSRLNLQLLTICIFVFTVVSCSKNNDVQPEKKEADTAKDCFLLILQNSSPSISPNTFYKYNSSKLMSMRRTNYYYEFAYNSGGKISDSKVYLVELNKPTSTQQPDTLAPFDRYFWSGDRLTKKNELKRDGMLRTEYLNTFDVQGRLTSVTILSVNTPTTLLQYEYDNKGYLSKRTSRLTGRFNNREYNNEVVFVESYEYGNAPVKHPESLLKDSNLPYDILGNDPWREWVATKTIQQAYNYKLGRLDEPREIITSIDKLASNNIALEILTEEPVVDANGQKLKRFYPETYSFNTDCKR